MEFPDFFFGASSNSLEKMCLKYNGWPNKSYTPLIRISSVKWSTTNKILAIFVIYDLLFSQTLVPLYHPHLQERTPTYPSIIDDEIFVALSRVIIPSVLQSRVSNMNCNKYWLIFQNFFQIKIFGQYWNSVAPRIKCVIPFGYLECVIPPR